MTIENLEHSLQGSNLNVESKRCIREQLSRHMLKSLKRQEHVSIDERNMSKKLKTAKIFLKDNPQLFFTKSDKGNVTVCMETSVYKEKMSELLSDESTYTIIKKNPLEKLKKSTSEILKYMNNNDYLARKYHNNQLTLTDTVLAKAYGLPKIHKDNVPLRPIISLVNSPTHFLAKVIYNELKSAINTPISHINNSFEIKEKIKSISIDRDHVLLSLDVTSLFTNVSCDLVLKSLERRIHAIHNNCKIPFDDILKFTTFLFDNTFFTFNDGIYRQIFGTPMGSPISPLFADIVMEDLETDCLNLLKEKYDCKPIFYWRYVDDTCMCVRKEHVDKIIETFNSWSDNLKFTFEIEMNNRINFLDVTLIRRNKDIITDWYQKPIASGRLINFNSNHPIQQKRNSVYNLTDRAILLSHPKFHIKNLEKVNKILINNDYPLDFIEKNVEHRMKKLTHQVSNASIESGSRPKIVCLSFKPNFYMMSSILKRFDIITMPIVDKCLKSLVRLGKDMTKKWDQTNIVYQFSCQNCPATYVGETKRSLKTRINEHKKQKTENSVVSIHTNENKHNFDWENVSVLDTERNYRKRLISEMIHIKSNINAINKKEDIDGLSNTYFSLLRTL